MFSLETIAAASDSLESRIIEMSKFGRPSVCMPSGSGWHCSIAMNTNAAGASFDIRSDFNMKSPSEAVAQCMERIHAAVRTIKGSV